jgi:anti-sigma-K factor RskA
MNRYEFEDKISDYLDNQLSISERKEFESFLENDDEAHVLLESVRKTIKLLDSPWPIKASDEFIPNLLNRINVEKNKLANKPDRTSKGLILGFSPANAFLMSAALICFVVISINIFPDFNNSNQSTIVSEPVNQSTMNLNQPSLVSKDNSSVFQADSSDTTTIPKTNTQLNDKIKFVKNKR